MLDLRSGRGRFDVTRTRPGPALAELVEHFWTVSWDLRGRDPHTQHTLPHPSVHLVAERDRSGVMGVLTGRFTRRLEGEGRAFGIRFRPAGFHPFLGAPVATLTDRRVAVAEVFGPAGDRLGDRDFVFDGSKGELVGRANPVDAADFSAVACRDAPFSPIGILKKTKGHQAAAPSTLFEAATFGAVVVSNSASSISLVIAARAPSPSCVATASNTRA